MTPKAPSTLVRAHSSQCLIKFVSSLAPRSIRLRSTYHGASRENRRGEQSISGILLDALSYTEEGSLSRNRRARARALSKSYSRHLVYAQAASTSSSRHSRLYAARQLNNQSSFLSFYSRSLLNAKQPHRASLLLAQILAKAIRRGVHRNGTGSKIARDDLETLEDYGYTTADLESWARIVSSGSSGSAALHLLQTGDCPIFVFLFVLQRRDMTSQALQLCIQYAIAATQGPERSKLPRPRSQSQDLGTVGLIVVRLLKHARLLRPSLMPKIAGLLHSHHRHQSNVNTPAFRNWLSNFFNSFLFVFGRRSANSPFINAEHAVQAQLVILRRMAQFEPHIHLDRRGYRALVMSHQRLQKTDKERFWASLKRQDWPPWKKDRIGTDSEIKTEEGISRSNALLRQFQMAGYSNMDWEDSALILSGWDTDSTPTYQHRHLHDSQLNLAASKDVRRRAQAHEDTVWAARVTSTSSALEAWIAFKMYRRLNSCTSRNTNQIYAALIEKLSLERIRAASIFKEGSIEEQVGNEPKAFLPGDGPWVLPPPSTIRNNLPSEDQVIGMAARRRVFLTPKQYAILIRRASSLSKGLNYFTRQLTRQPQPAVSLLQELISGSSISDAIHKIPKISLSALVLLFCRFRSRCSYSELSIRRGGYRYNERAELWRLLSDPNRFQPYIKRRSFNTIWPALRLLLIQDSASQSCWDELLKVLASADLELLPIGERSERSHRYLNDMLSFRLAEEIIQIMRIRNIRSCSNHLTLLSNSYMKALFSAREVMLRDKTKIDSSDAGELEDIARLVPPANRLLKSGLDAVCAVAYNVTDQSLFHPDDHLTSQPFSSPTLASVDALAQAICIRGDWGKLLLLLQWLRRNRCAIEDAASATMQEHHIGIAKANIVGVAQLTLRRYDQHFRPAEKSKGVARHLRGSFDLLASPSDIQAKAIRSEIRQLRFYWQRPSEAEVLRTGIHSLQHLRNYFWQLVRTFRAIKEENAPRPVKQTWNSKSFN